MCKQNACLNFDFSIVCFKTCSFNDALVWFLVQVWDVINGDNAGAMGREDRRDLHKHIVEVIYINPSCRACQVGVRLARGISTAGVRAACVVHRGRWNQARLALRFSDPLNGALGRSSSLIHDLHSRDRYDLSSRLRG